MAKKKFYKMRSPKPAKKKKGVVAEGTFERRANGKNSFIPEDGGEPVFVAERNSMYAMKGDKVKVQVFAKRKGHTSEAEVIEVLHRVKDTVVGVLEVSTDRKSVV